ncbi:MAG TPA: substrate-binding domain-containing protein [Verrucomicrobiae bacterium]|nr:substrate-binding domain-containing protein [Verrucomicrobiae bacterium]
MSRWCLVVLLAVACAGSVGRVLGEDKKLTIAVIPKGTTHEFWKTVHAGAEDAAKELGVDIVWKGPLREDDREEQIKVVEDMITRGVDGIALAPLDDTALRAPVATAAASGIPVVIFDSDLKSDKHISFVATDNHAGGKIGGDYLAKLLGGKGKVIMLRYQEGSGSTGNRERGFLDAIASYKDIQVVSANQYAGVTTETAYKASENLLAPLKTADGKLSVDGIFCPNEASAFGMLRALQDGGLAGKVHFVGFDSSSKLIEALRKGEMDALVLQNPRHMGYLAVKTIVQHLRGQAVEKRIDTGVRLITRDDLEKPDVKQLLGLP